jgi:hypothetical protein
MNQTMEPGKESIGGRTGHDQEIWQRIEKLVGDYHVTVPELLGNFPAYARRIHLSRFLAHYEIFKKIADLPGGIAELGVFRGSSLLTFAKLLEIFNPGDRSRKVIGFDHFQGLNEFTSLDGPAVSEMGKKEGGWSAANYQGELLENIDLFHADSFIPRAKRIEFVNGDIRQSVPEYVSKNPGLRLSLLHFDCDLYEPTLIGLKALYPLVVSGGIVLFDEYGLTEWAGESAAVDEYFAGQSLRISKLPWLSTPGGYVVKP